MARASSRTTPRNAPAGRLIYFTIEQDERLQKAAKRQGDSITKIVRDGTMRVVREIEADTRTVENEREEKKERAFLPRNLRSSKGLGLSRRRNRDDDDVREPSFPASAPPVVNVTMPATGGDIVERFADYVRGAPNSIARQDREREVVKMIRAAARDENDQRELARRLDEKLGTGSLTMRKVYDWLTGKVI